MGLGASQKCVRTLDSGDVADLAAGEFFVSPIEVESLIGEGVFGANSDVFVVYAVVS